MTQKNKDINSRELILSRLRGAGTPSWHEKWPDEVPGGGVFPPVGELLPAFRNELEALGGEVWLEYGEEALFQRLKKLVDKRQWGDLVIVDDNLRELVQKNMILASGFGINPLDFEAGVTRCEALVALTGSVMVSSLGSSGRRMNVFPPVHVVVARKSQLVASIGEGFQKIEGQYSGRPSHITLISGPSRTADIEKTLVMGAHGPGELIVLIDMES
jgi:L-lactate dehydrogenase complex protein LldG